MNTSFSHYWAATDVLLRHHKQHGDLKVLSALLKKKYLVPRSELQLDWKPLFDLFQVLIFSNWAKHLLQSPVALGGFQSISSGSTESTPRLQSPDQVRGEGGGKKKNIRDSVLIGIMQGVSRILHRWEHKRDAGQVDSHALPCRQVLLWTIGLYCHPLT